MCYGYKPVKTESGKTTWILGGFFRKLFAEGKIVTARDGYHFAKDTVGVGILRSKEIEIHPMRWDLVPRDFLKKENLSLKDMLKRKNSRAKDSKGFSSFNARLETVDKLWSFRRPWSEGQRCVTPVVSFRERPNMDGAPKEFTGREYKIHLDGQYYLAGIWDEWENAAGEKLQSCTVITTDSIENSKIRGIWHERCPIILKESQVEEWLDPLTVPTRAKEMCQLVSEDILEIEEVIKEPKPRTQEE